MKLNITKVKIEGSDRGTSQSEWHIDGNVNGSAVSIFYLDCGNNAEYDDKTECRVEADDPAIEQAVTDWLEEKGDYTLTDLEAGMSIEIGGDVVPQPPQPSPKQKPGPGVGF